MSLSDKMDKFNLFGELVPVDWVREAVKELMEKFPLADGVHYITSEQLHFAIKEGFGEKLIK